ncbi:MAG: hypothetical protein AB7V16_07380 [Vulcanibacillus sp.]
MFEKASRMKLRFQSSRGVLSVEDLWDLSLEQLNTLAKGLKKQLQNAAEEDFLEVQSSEDLIVQLEFDIVLYILNTKKNEKKAREEAVAKKNEKKKLLDILNRKKDESLETLSEEELVKRINELDN